jgi:hypothetical protein
MCIMSYAVHIVLSGHSCKHHMTVFEYHPGPDDAPSTSSSTITKLVVPLVPPSSFPLTLLLFSDMPCSYHTDVRTSYSSTRSGRVYRANEVAPRVSTRRSKSIEIIAHIFRSICELDVDCCRIGFRLSRVSRRLRALALVCPVLWRTIQIDSSDIRSSSRFFACCELSRTTTLNVVYQPTRLPWDDRDFYSWCAFLKAIVDQAHRLRRVTIATGTSQHYMAAMHVLDVALPAFEYLCVREQPASAWQIRDAGADDDGNELGDYQGDEESIEDYNDWSTGWEEGEDTEPLLSEDKVPRFHELRLDGWNLVNNEVNINDLVSLSIEDRAMRCANDFLGWIIDQCMLHFDAPNLRSLRLLGGEWTGPWPHDWLPGSS